MPSLLDKEKLTILLQPGGPLDLQMKGYEFRPQQQQMLENILDAYNFNQIALIEAGTGIGKSLAYLLPAILWNRQNGERTLISTNTISLQEQLLLKDIPLASKVLNTPIKAVLVKGMSNYLCLRRLEETKYEAARLDVEEQEVLEKIHHWSNHAKDGSRSSLPLPVRSSLWETICAESESCTKRRCPFFQDCHFFKARKEAEEAHLLVANHALFFADLAYRDKASEKKESEELTGFLPGYSRIILDEAHHLEKIATDFFADRLSYLSLIKTLGRLGADKQGRLALLSQKILVHFMQRMPTEISRIHLYLSLDLPGMRHELLKKITELFESLLRFLQMQRTEASDSAQREHKLRLLSHHYEDPLWKEFAAQGELFLKAFNQYLTSIDLILKEFAGIDFPPLLEQTESIRAEIAMITNRLKAEGQNLAKMLQPQTEKSRVVWIEGSLDLPIRDLRLVSADLDISEKMAASLFSQFPTTILCSATLTTNRSFQFIRKNLGLSSPILSSKTCIERTYPSPFDYEKQTLLVVPKDLPDPLDANFSKIICEKILRGLRASRGGAFVLFTSYTMMLQCYHTLLPQCQSEGWETLLQGTCSRNFLLEKFKKQRNAVLFGTDSFWEGVDVAGDGLRCVIIVKLPFRVPSEPLVAAKTEWIKSQGGQPFTDYTLPHAIVKFKQGFGRLIRSKSDHGCVVCLDPRLISRGYGRQFLQSLPACNLALTSDDAELQTAMESHYKARYFK